MKLQSVKTKPVEILRLRTFVPKGKWFHFGRSKIETDATSKDHTHADFDEIFIVQRGEGVHHINGKKIRLAGGSIVFMRAKDRHSFSGKMIWTNIAFTAGHAPRLIQTYSLKTPDLGRGRMPHHAKVSEAALERLAVRLQGLQEGSRLRLPLDLFLLELLDLVFSEKKSEAPGKEGLPTWLSQAVNTLSAPEHFRHGTRGLISLTGKSPEYLARAVRRWYGKTPTDLVNEARLRWAGSALETTNQQIAEIAEACGYESVPYFYEVFREKYRLTPQRYRETVKKIAGF
ncbi:MAG: helix-turn-helix domain-containing protein [Spirochaetia bacterium]|nr:helix-turn-helix domain-containing protein [Spirochaetia bacterium]